MIKQLKAIRNELLLYGNIKEYKLICDFFELPDETEIESIVKELSIEMRKMVYMELNKVIDIYETDNHRYRDEILYGQRIIWSQVLNCYEALLATKDKLVNFNLSIYDNDYIQACSEIKRIFAYYAEVQVEMSKFEDILGVDRYLDTLCDSDIRPLEGLAEEIKKIFEQKVKPYKNIFVEKWSTANIHNIILHELVHYDGNNQICTLFECNKKKTVLFIIDGFGFGQYQWHKNIRKDAINYTYNENIFAWLEKSDCIKEYALGSAYITDTGAGMAQIFTGKSAKETGIVSSKVSKINNSTLIETKRLDVCSFKNTFNTDFSSITELVKVFDKESKVFYGSRYGNNVSGFSNFIFKGADTMEVLPPERMFSILEDDLLDKKSGLDVVYLTGIDNSGHTMGAYSKFEKFEHEKFNMLFRNFLVEIAIEHPEYFNGDTTFIITADHGMAESSKLMISRKALKDRLFLKNIRGVNFIENNRALLLYGLNAVDYERTRDCINTYFDELGIEADIIVKRTDEYDKWYCTDEDNNISKLAPDMVIRLLNNGLFYSKETSPHLLHYGGHGGGSAGELFVPLLHVTLNDKLLKNIQNRFINIM